MEYKRKELMSRLSDYIRRGLTNQQLYDLIDSLWRDPPSPRTSGFDISGGKDCVIQASVQLMDYYGGISNFINFSIEPLRRKFKFYHYRNVLSLEKKQEYENILIPASEGKFVIFYEKDIETKHFVLQYKQDPTHEEMEDILQYSVMIAAIYYDSSREDITYFGDNRHGSLWNPWIHWSWHQTFNSMRETGLELTDVVSDGDGSKDAHAQFGISPGSCFHEDIYVTSEGKSAPADLPVWHFIQGSKPRICDDTINSLKVSGTLCYNDNAIIPADDNKYVFYHLFFTNDILEPYISVMGQAQYDSVGDATALLANELQQVRDKLPHENILHIGTLLYETSSEFGNTAKSRVVSQAFTVHTDMSITGDGSPAKPVKLVNDEETPDAGKVYGAHYLTGAKGYNQLDPRLFGWGQGIFLHVEASGIGGYKQALPLDPEDAEDAYTVSGTSEDGEIPMQVFATEADYPGVTQIKAGPWVFDLWMAVSTNRNCQMKMYVYKRDSGGTETLLFSFTIPVTAVGISQHLYNSVQNAIDLDATDRLVFKPFFLNPTLISTTMYLGVEGATWKSNVRIPLTAQGKQIQSDWTQEDTEAVDFIKNKPGGNLEDIAFDFNDVTKGVAQTYILDIKASFNYDILSVVLQSDSTMDNVEIQIGSTPITWTDSVTSIDVTDSVSDTEAISDNSVTEEDQVKLVTSGTDGDPTLIRGKLRIQRI